MQLTDKVTIPTQILARQIGEETVILDLEGGTYFGLDPVGTRIWQLFGEGKPLVKICDVMMIEYDVSRDVIERDVMKILDELVALGLIVPA